MINNIIKRYVIMASVIGIYILLCASTLQAAPISSDPGKIGVGARALGMGNAFTALSDDASAIFTNPAGLNLYDNMQFTSMYSTIFEELHYKQLGLAFPLGSGMGGVGFVGTSIENIGITTLNANNRPVAIKDVSFHDDIFYLTYAENITGLLKPLNWPGDFLLGSSLKFYSKGSPGIDSYNGSGISADLGMLYKWSPDITMGMQYKNFLPRFASFGSIKWSGSEDELSSVLKLGSSINYYKWNTICNIDADVDPGFKKPLLFHIGGEWRPMNSFIFRGGIDQIANPMQNGTGVYSNYTLGCGLEISGIRFDYAFKSFYNEDANHYFTLSFLGEPGPYKWANKPKDMYFLNNGRYDLLNIPVVKINTPAKNMVTARTKLLITGSSSSAVTLNINGKDIFFKGGPSFNYVVDLAKLGRTTVDINLKYNGQDINILSKKVIRLPDTGGPIREEDMPKSILNSEVSYNYNTPIPGKVLVKDILAMANIYVPQTKGKAPDFDAILQIAKKNNLLPETPEHPFNPEKAVSWGEAMALLAKIEGYAVDTKKTDPKSHWTTPFIRAAKEHQLIPAYWNKSPDLPINGREILDVLNRSKVGKNKVRELVDWVSADGPVVYDDGIKTQRFDSNYILQKVDGNTQFSNASDQYNARRPNYNSTGDKPNIPSYIDNPIDRASRLYKLYQNQFHNPMSRSGDTATPLATPGSPGNTRAFFAEKQPNAPAANADKAIKAPNTFASPLDRLTNVNQASGEINTRFSQETENINNKKKAGPQPVIPVAPVIPEVQPIVPPAITVPAETITPTKAEEPIADTLAATANIIPVVQKTLEDYQVPVFPPQNSIIVEISIDKDQVVLNAKGLEDKKYLPKVFPLIINDTTLYELYLPQIEDKDLARELIKELRKLGYAAYQNEMKPN